MITVLLFVYSAVIRGGGGGVQSCVVYLLVLIVNDIVNIHGVGLLLR